MSAEATATAVPTTAATATAALTAPTPGSLPASYVESDPAQRGTAKVAHFMGLLSILGTGIFYVIKKNDPNVGTFAKDQMKEAFNFHLLLFCVNMALNIVGAIAGAALTALAMVFSLVVLAIWVCGLVLSIKNGLKAGSGQVARYPARLSVLK